jgi:integrase
MINIDLPSWPTCDLKWDDIDLGKRTIIPAVQRSTDSSHYLERDELGGLKRLKREQEAAGIASTYVFVNERGQPFSRMGIARMIESREKLRGYRFAYTFTC